MTLLFFFLRQLGESVMGFYKPYQFIAYLHQKNYFNQLLASTYNMKKLSCLFLQILLIYLKREFLIEYRYAHNSFSSIRLFYFYQELDQLFWNPCLCVPLPHFSDLWAHFTLLIKLLFCSLVNWVNCLSSIDKFLYPRFIQHWCFHLLWVKPFDLEFASDSIVDFFGLLLRYF